MHSDWNWHARWNSLIRMNTNSCGSREFPLLEWSDEQNRFTAMHHPFTMPMEEDLQYIDSDPGRVRAKAYDIVLNGNEIEAEVSVSSTRRSRVKCLKYLDSHRNRHRSSSDSF